MQRPDIEDHRTREMAVKMVFLLASYLPRVSEDWVVGVPGLELGTRGLRVSYFANQQEGTRFSVPRLKARQYSELLRSLHRDRPRTVSSLFYAKDA
jgi:hypothetical protein